MTRLHDLIENLIFAMKFDDEVPERILQDIVDRDNVNNLE